MSTPLLEVEDLTIKYRTGDSEITAVSNVSFTIESREYFGLVGESGCGKSTIALSILGGLPENGYISDGKILFKGTEIQEYSEKEYNEKLRWKNLSWIPQGSMSSLDPLQKISEQAVGIAKEHTNLEEGTVLDQLAEYFEIVGLSPNRIDDYPHQFSGGMQQRALIAFSLLLEPSLIIADEPTTALDVIMQDQVFSYLHQLRDKLEISILLITHDISLQFETVDRMGIMHAGQLAEIGTVDEIYNHPRHPYSILLQQAFPDHRFPERELSTIDGKPPRNVGNVSYCTFAERCPWKVEECEQSAPPLEPIDGEMAQAAACFRSSEVLEEYQAEHDLLRDIHGK